MLNTARSMSVSISSGESSIPRLVLNLERVDAAGAASFLAAVADMLTQELAARDGLSLDHPLAKSVGPLSQAAADELTRLWESTKEDARSGLYDPISDAFIPATGVASESGKALIEDLRVMRRDVAGIHEELKAISAAARTYERSTSRLDFPQ